jgi:hypothetical protein
MADPGIPQTHNMRLLSKSLWRAERAVTEIDKPRAAL